ncbi:MAG: hypothetical protein WCQ72_02910 [Eubacteriales bacterium]
MHRILLVLIIIALLLSSCGDTGVDVGDGETVAVSFKTEETAESRAALSERISGMNSVFRALITVISNENADGDSLGYRPDDEQFVSDALAAMISIASAEDSAILSHRNSDGGAEVEGALIRDYLGALFENETEIPPLYSGERVTLLPQNCDSTADIVITDVAADSAGYLAYVNHIGENGEIMEMYLFTMDEAGAPAASSLPLGFSIKSCAVIAN